jgi:uncharacterized membrane protein YgaE (UPF0421/DUF939 family)
MLTILLLLCYDQQAETDRDRKKLEAAPDGIIQEVLDFLNDFEKKSAEEQKRIIALREILSEKRGLLIRRLAE